MENKNVTAIIPRDEAHWLELRAKNLNSTEIPALFDLSPYQTKFELWHGKKNGTVLGFNENSRTEWGKRLQNSIAEGVALDQKWQVREMKEYMYDSDLKIGSSFDFAIEAGTVRLPYQTERTKIEPGILEIKNVDYLQFRDKWTKNEDGTHEAPPHIELQVQHQMLISGRKYCCICPLVGGNDVKLIFREADVYIQTEIVNRSKEFWESIEKNQEPTPDFVRDAEIISKIYSYAEPGKTLATESSDLLELANQYKIAGKQVSQYEDAKKAIKAQILQLIGDVERVEHPLFTISAKVSPPTHVEAFDRAAFRSFRITERKQK